MPAQTILLSEVIGALSYALDLRRESRPATHSGRA